MSEKLTSDDVQHDTKKKVGVGESCKIFQKERQDIEMKSRDFTSPTLNSFFTLSAGAQILLSSKSKSNSDPSSLKKSQQQKKISKAGPSNESSLNNEISPGLPLNQEVDGKNKEHNKDPVSETPKAPSSDPESNPNQNTSKDSENTQITHDEIPVIDISDSSLEDPSGRVEEKKDKVRFGEKRKISPGEKKNLDKWNKDSFSTAKLGKFYALTTGAQVLLKAPPVVHSDPDQLKKRADELAQGAEKNKSLLKRKADVQEEFYCRVCDAHSNSESSYYAHMQGKKHLKAVANKFPTKDNSADRYFCVPCDLQSNSEQSYQTHITGKKHIKKLALIQQGDQTNMQGLDRTEKAEVQKSRFVESLPPFRVTKRGVKAKVQSQLDACTAACIGLNYVSEVLRANPESETLYACFLCYTVCQEVNIVSHIIGYKHRLNYMKSLDTIQYEKLKKQDVKKSVLTRMLEELCSKLEEKHSRGRVVVEQEVGSAAEYGEQPFLPPRLKSGFDNSPHFRGVDNAPSFGGGDNAPSFGGGDNAPSFRGGDNAPSFRGGDNVPFGMNDIYNLPLKTRMDLIYELGQICPEDLHTDNDAMQLEHCLKNFERAVFAYKKRPGIIEDRGFAPHAGHSNAGRGSWIPMVNYPSTHNLRPFHR